MKLKELRLSYNLTQKEAAKSINVPLRTYVRYESITDETNLKYLKMIDLLKEKYEISETKGIYSVDKIKEIVNNVINTKYKDKVSFCYLFGSYAKGYAKNESDVDLCVSTTLKGLDFVGLIENLRQALNKVVDLIRFDGLENNLDLLYEIMKDGIKIYG